MVGVGTDFAGGFHLQRRNSEFNGREARFEAAELSIGTGITGVLRRTRNTRAKAKGAATDGSL